MARRKRTKTSTAKAAKLKKPGGSREQNRSLTALTLQLGEPLCEGEGMELIHVQCRIEPPGRVLRLYIDKPGGVKLDDCQNISRQIGDLLDVHTDDDTAYLLEVSSPGVNRPLGKPDDFNRFAGQTACIRTLTPINEQKKFTGELAGMNDEIVTLRMEGESMNIPLSQIKDARLIEYQGEN